MTDLDRETLERLVTLEPGAELTTLLSQLDQSALSGYWLVEYIGAAQRLKAWVDACMVAATNELGYCPTEGERTSTEPAPDAPPERVAARHGGAVAELETRLGWGRGRAGSYDSMSWGLAEEFPDTWVMLHAGDIDLQAARAIAVTIPCLDDPAQQRQMEQIVLAWIRKLMRSKRRVPPHQIRNKVNREVARADPDGAKQRHDHAVRSRGLRLVSSLDSVADLQLHDIPADQAVVMFNYIDTLAQQVQKDTSNERTIGQLRADVAASLLSGMATFHHYDPDDPTDGAGDTADADDSDENVEPSDESADDVDDVDDVDGDVGDETAAEAETRTEPAAEAESDAAAEAESAESAELPGPSPRMSPPAEAPTFTRAGVRVRAKNVLHVSLTDLLDLHEAGQHDPAILGSYGPVIRGVAERILAHHLDNPDAEYTVVVTDPRTGRPRQIHPVNARLFTGRLRDIIDIRWPNCTWPTPCDKPSPDCVGDHSVDHAKSGATSDGNGNPLCRPHNREKTINGWRQHRPDEDTIVWTSAFGHQYTVRADDGGEESDTRDEASGPSGPDPSPY